MPIKIGVDESGNVFVDNTDCGERAICETDLEAAAIEIVSNIVFSHSGKKVGVERRSDSYISLLCEDGRDFLRVKLTERTKWFSIDSWFLSDEDKNDNRLSDYCGCKSRHWKIKLSNVADLAKYEDLIYKAYIGK